MLLDGHGSSKKETGGIVLCKKTRGDFFHSNIIVTLPAFPGHAGILPQVTSQERVGDKNSFISIFFLPEPEEHSNRRIFQHLNVFGAVRGGYLMTGSYAFVWSMCRLFRPSNGTADRV